MDPPLLIVVVLIDSFCVLFVCFSLFFWFSFYLPMFLFVCFSFFDVLFVSFLPFSFVKIESRFYKKSSLDVFVRVSCFDHDYDSRER